MRFLKKYISSLRNPDDERSVAVESGLVLPTPIVRPSSFRNRSDTMSDGSESDLPRSRRTSIHRSVSLSRRPSVAVNYISENGDGKSVVVSEEIDNNDQNDSKCCRGCIPAMDAALGKLQPKEGDDAESMVIESGINDSDIAFHHMFEALDRDGSGSIDIFELRKMVQGLGLPCSKQELKQMFARMDRNNDGSISYEDFKQDLLSRWSTPEEKQHLLRELFRMFDLTGNGKIEPKEVKVVMMSIGEKVSNQEIDEMFRQFNKGKIKSEITIEGNNLFFFL